MKAIVRLLVVCFVVGMFVGCQKEPGAANPNKVEGKVEHNPAGTPPSK